MIFQIYIEPEVLTDIQESIDWYEQRQTGLGDRFYEELNQFIDTLKLSPWYQVRYENVRCLPLKNFPYMIHFTLNEPDNIVVIRGVFHTKQNPKK